MKEQWFCGQVEQHKTALYRLARSIVRNDDDAQDAVAEAVCKAFAKRHTLRHPEKCKSWLMQITANEAYTICRRRQRLVPLEEQEVPVPPPEAESGLWGCVQALPDTLRACVVLFYYDGLSVREIAGVLRLTEGAVKTRLSRGRQALRTILEKEDIHGL